MGAGETGGSGGTSAGCPEGSAGCDCYGNQSCDDDLVCADGKCLPPGCAPGTENCTCDAGTCGQGLQCNDGICRPRTGGTGTDGGMSTSGTSTTGSTSTPQTSGMVTGGSCDMPPPGQCGQCFANGCCTEFESCVQNEACGCTLQCIGMGVRPSTCLGNCGVSPEYFEVAQCQFGACSDCAPEAIHCLDGELPGPNLCSFCAAEACCDQLTACRNDSNCFCIYECLSANNTAGYDVCRETCDSDHPGDVNSIALYQELSGCTIDSGCQHPLNESACYPPPS